MLHWLDLITFWGLWTLKIRQLKRFPMMRTQILKMRISCSMVSSFWMKDLEMRRIQMIPLILRMKKWMKTNFLKRGFKMRQTLNISIWFLSTLRLWPLKQNARLLVKNQSAKGTTWVIQFDPKDIMLKSAENWLRLVKNSSVQCSWKRRLRNHHLQKETKPHQQLLMIWPSRMARKMMKLKHLWNNYSLVDVR